MLFEGPEEESKALIWMRNHLTDKKMELGRRKSEQLNSIFDLLSDIDGRQDQIKAEGSGEDSDFHDHLWERFIFSMSGKWIDDQDTNWDCPYVWGEWVHSAAQELTIGHSDCHTRTYVPRGGGSAQHYYSCIPDDVVWKLTPLTQKGMTFFIGVARVSEIDAVCSVPQLPAEMDSSEAAQRVLDKERGDDQWQRRVEAKRIASIRHFIDKGGNLIANSAILFSGPNDSISVSDDGTVKVSFEDFLEKTDTEWCDHRGKADKRPVWLIDGQHRTRGLAQSETGIDLEIPIIYFPPSFDLSQSAKIFAEINTLQKKLSPLHTLFMQHRFGIPSPTGKRDFKTPWDDGKAENRNSRANHLSYECAAYLASNEKGPLYDRIKILDSNSSNFAIIKAGQWVDFSRSWFGEGQIYGPDTCTLNQEEINNEVENYFRALVETCNHGDWEDGRHRWCLKANPKGLIQRHGPSQAILKLYPHAWLKAKGLGADSPIPVGVFKEVLAPLTWVDWLDTRLKGTFLTGGERGRNALRVWMRNAIEHGEMYGQDEVMSDEIHSQAGRGILSHPGDGEITVVGDKKWPYGGKPLVIRAQRPANTLATSVWSIIDSKKVNRSPDNPSIQSSRGVAEYTLRYSKWMDDVDHMDIRVDWYNTVTPPGKALLRLIKP